MIMGEGRDVLTFFDNISNKCSKKVLTKRKNPHRIKSVVPQSHITI